MEFLRKLATVVMGNPEAGDDESKADVSSANGEFYPPRDSGITEMGLAHGSNGLELSDDDMPTLAEGLRDSVRAELFQRFTEARRIDGKLLSMNDVIDIVDDMLKYREVSVEVKLDFSHTMEVVDDDVHMLYINFVPELEKAKVSFFSQLTIPDEFRLLVFKTAIEKFAVNTNEQLQVLNKIDCAIDPRWRCATPMSSDDEARVLAERGTTPDDRGKTWFNVEESYAKPKNLAIPVVRYQTFKQWEDMNVTRQVIKTSTEGATVTIFFIKHNLELYLLLAAYSGSNPIVEDFYESNSYCNEIEQLKCTKKQYLSLIHI